MVFPKLRDGPGGKSRNLGKTFLAGPVDGSVSYLLSHTKPGTNLSKLGISEADAANATADTTTAIAANAAAALALVIDALPDFQGLN